jgi:2-polyprenyl-3-methyl-5-hydroxy-6-metoxy-1,4-benzoquinol methylase
MNTLLRSEDIKPDFAELKARWAKMLTKYFLSEGVLDPKFTVEVDCPYCGGQNQKKGFNLNGFIHKRCENCQTVYVSPRLNDNFIEELYSDEYYSEMFTRSMLPVFAKRKGMIGKRKYSEIVNIAPNKNLGSVLDIGAGIGEVIDVFKDEGWSTYAVEMNDTAAKWLEKLGLDQVFHGSFDDYIPNQKFDVIMAWNVIEHVVNPAQFLEKVCTLLAPGGVFVSEVPHGNSLLLDIVERIGFDPKRILMGEQHIVLYSTDAYVGLHERNGFKKLHLQTNGLDCDTIFKECNIEIHDKLLAAMQASIDKKLYGDLVRGYWGHV